MRPRFLFAPTASVLPCRLRDAAQPVGPARFWSPPDTPLIPLPRIDGVLIGYLFDRPGRTRCFELGSAEQLAIASSGGRHLLDRHSGAYVAFWHGPDGDAVHILRDPSGMQPALLVHRDGHWTCCSDLDLLPDTRFEIDWAQLASGLRHPGVAAASCPLRDVTELLPGEGATIRDGRLSRHLAWQPWRFFPRQVETPEACRARVADAVDGAVAGWASLGPVLLELSGGLDSSILAAALASSGRRWSALTFATPARDGDERSYARLVANQHRVPLDETVLRPVPAFATMPVSRRLPRPSGMAVMREVDRLLQTHVANVPETILFSGGGGDNVFAMLGSTGPILDAWRIAGRATAWQTVADLARLHDGSRLVVLRRLARRLVLDWFAIDRTPGDTVFLRPEIGRRAARHPWLAVPGRSLPGAVAHIASIVAAQTVLDAHDRYSFRTTLFPLLSQPVLETCLSVPSWLWTSGGRDRAIAREAFALRLPREVAERRSKARLESMIVAIFEGAREPLRDLLLGGHLMRQSLLDRPAIEAVLTRAASAQDWNHAKLLRLADAELWVRSILTPSD